jgi:hypothetical protein
MSLVALAVLLVGVVLQVSGVWIVWDWVHSFKPYLNRRFEREWVFYGPFYSIRVGPDRWTLPFDIALLLMLLGGFGIAFGAFLL